MINIVVPSLEEDMALIGLTDEDLNRTQLTEDTDTDADIDFDDDDVGAVFEGGESSDDRSQEILTRVRETLGTLIESVEEEDTDEVAKSYDLVAQIATSLGEAFAEMEDDGLLSEDADDESIVESLVTLARACLDMSDSLEEGLKADADVHDQLADNIEAVLEGIEVYESAIEEMDEDPFEGSEYDDEDE